MEQDRSERAPEEDRDRVGGQEEARESAVEEWEEQAPGRQLTASVLSVKRAHPTSPAPPAYNRQCPQCGSAMVRA